MEKQITLSVLFTVLFSMGCTKVIAHDIEVVNEDGVIIYYNYANNGTELAVTYRGSSYSEYNEYSGNVVIPDEVTYMNKTRKVTSIESEAFMSCYALSSVSISNNVTSIGSNAFTGCQRLTSMTIPNSVKSIEKNAFQTCTGLTSVTIGKSVTSIGSNAFIYCNGLMKVIVKDIAAWCKISFGSNDANPLYCAKHLYGDENTEITDLVIPNSVTSISNYAFWNCSDLTSITIPNSVTTIGNYAFYGCSGLTSISIPNSVTIIGDGAFYGCNSLQKVIVKDIAAWCKISFGSSDANPLYCAKHLYSDENTEITDLVIPNSVTSIGGSTFRDCSGLTSITIPNSVTSIGNYSFKGCSGLTSVSIPNSVTNIGGSAFRDCNGLTSVTIGNSVASIGDFAFDGADILTVISLIENPFSISGKTSDYYRTFSKNTYNNATLYVPVGSITKYKSTVGWRDFVFIEEGIPSDISSLQKEKINESKRYTLDGKPLAQPQNGLNIIKMTDGTTKKIVVK